VDEAPGRKLATLREERDHLVAEAEALRRREGDRAELDELVRRLLERMQRSWNADGIMRAGVEEVATALGAGRCRLQLLDGSRLAKPTVEVAQADAEPLDDSLVQALGAQALEEGRTIRYPEPDRSGPGRKAPGDTPPLLAAPIFRQAEPWGALLVQGPANATWTDHDVERLESVATQVGIGIGRVGYQEAAERRAARLLALHVVSTRVLAEKDPNRTLDLILEQLARLLDAGTSSFLLWDPKRQVLRTHRSFDTLGVRLPTEVRPDEGIAGQVFRTGRAAVVSDYQHWEHAIQVSRDEKMVAAVGVPLRRGGEIVGILIVRSYDPNRRFTEEDEQLASLFAAQAEVTLERTGLLSEMARRAERLEALYEAAELISSSLDTQQVLNSVVRSACTLLNMSHARLWVVSENGRHLHMVAAFEGGEPVGGPTDLPIDGSLLGSVLKGSEPFQTSDVADNPLFYDRDWVRGEGFHCFLAVPLRVRERPYGAISMFSREVRAFEADELALLSALGQQATTAVENARLYREAVTQRNQLDAVLASMNDGVVILNADGSVALVNPAARQFLTAAQEKGGVVDEQKATLLLGVPDADNPTVARSVTIGEQVLSVTVSPVYSYDGEYLGQVAVQRDVTERARIR